MASGDEGDPPRLEGRRGSHGRRLSSEGQVAEEAEEVFRSFVFHRYQQERKEQGAELPPDPEIEQIQLDLRNTNSQVGQRLAIIGDDIYRRYDADFCTMLAGLQLTPSNVYKHFKEIASSLFDSGINWGRVIALLAFGYRMAMHVWQSRVGAFLRQIARYLGEFMLQNSIASWIAQQGGWSAVLLREKKLVTLFLLAAAVGLLGPVVVRRFFTS